MKNKSRSEIEFSLKERIKELECLYSISRIFFQGQNGKLDDIFKQLLEIIPAAWQYPEYTTCKIHFNNNDYLAPNYKESDYYQKADILINKNIVGYIEVAYLKKMPDFFEGPFLKEERHLINTIATELSLFIDKSKQKKEKQILEARLRHTDRLITIGEFSAGIAHDLTEPLGTILGFAQLLKKDQNISGQSADDLKRIVDASLYARDILRKLMTFAKSNERDNKLINFNNVINNATYLLETRSLKHNITFQKKLDENLVSIRANPVQLNQVIINLCANSIQAMPEGGTIVLTTSYDDKNIFISIKDSGVGIPENIAKQIFEPFFSTKTSSTNSGLGLSVVHGIVTSLKGTIIMKSKPGLGTSFKITIPHSKTK